MVEKSGLDLWDTTTNGKASIRVIESVAVVARILERPLGLNY